MNDLTVRESLTTPPLSPSTVINLDDILRDIPSPPRHLWFDFWASSESNELQSQDRPMILTPPVSEDTTTSNELLTQRSDITTQDSSIPQSDTPKEVVKADRPKRARRFARIRSKPVRKEPPKNPVYLTFDPNALMDYFKDAPKKESMPAPPPIEPKRLLSKATRQATITSDHTQLLRENTRLVKDLDSARLREEYLREEIVKLRSAITNSALEPYLSTLQDYEKERGTSVNSTLIMRFPVDVIALAHAKRMKGSCEQLGVLNSAQQIVPSTNGDHDHTGTEKDIGGLCVHFYDDEVCIQCCEDCSRNALSKAKP